MSSLSERVGLVRRCLGGPEGDLSIEKLAELAGLSRALLQRWLRGGIATPEQLALCATEWGVSPEWLRAGNGEPPPDDLWKTVRPPQVSRGERLAEATPEFAGFPDRLTLAVKRVRRLHGYSQNETAALCQIKSGSLSRYMRGLGYQSIAATSTILLAKGLEVRLEWLLTGRGEMLVEGAAP